MAVVSNADPMADFTVDSTVGSTIAPTLVSAGDLGAPLWELSGLEGVHCGVPVWGSNVDSTAMFHYGTPLWGSSVLLHREAPVSFSCGSPVFFLPVCASVKLSCELYYVM